MAEYIMNGTQFYRLFAAETGANLQDAKVTCAAVFELLSRCIKENDQVLIQGFGTFKKKTRKSHVIGNITGEGTITVPPKEVIVFNEWGSLSKKNT